eukprot:CAMPEP_0195287320 /NCGR_PEP_ID=MMETSP0707-20130614/4430_1 /TAXON_ID=33640 /ORGANISM="Asterionellopsis glacialis, Strain CCMP134" /LENGTH=938 /DNA_ID=CAMNT_0040347067 /DNA_START=96 /DNA_END=2912 /DNA_ORIENTATION=+
MSSTLLDDAFELLQVATNLEQQTKGDESCQIEAATKYYQACYLLKRYVQRLPLTSSNNDNQTRQLLEDKITHYEHLASHLLSTANKNNKNDDDQQQHIITSRSKPPASSSRGARRNLFLETANEHHTPSNMASVSSPRFGTSFHYNSTDETTNSSELATIRRRGSANTITTKAGQANARLAHALDLDENGSTKRAIQEYMAAAQLYLSAIKLADSFEKENHTQKEESISSLLKRRAEGALDRIEQLKHGGTSKTSSSSTGRNTLRESKVGERKTGQTTTTTTNATAPRLTPSEVDVLKRSSVIGSKIVLPWSDEDVRKLVTEITAPMASPWTDPDGFLKLSSKQQDRLYKWARPGEIVKIRSSVGGLQQSKPIMVKAITPYSIRQQFVQDCSFIASLCICSAFERRFQKRLVTSIIYPQNSNGQPVISPTGKYMVKLWLNGVARQVIVDDYFPVDRRGSLLCSHTTTSGLELWVSIIEKAYMKLCGGYDFPGSNSGVDLFSLTGWIPERIFFPEKPEKVRDFETPVERCWERLVSANSFGDCLITVSTSDDITEDVSKSIGLVTGHAYAVLSVIETRSGLRLLQMKNPWAYRGWTGKYSSRDRSSWSDRALCAEVGYDPVEASKYDDGVFWISWTDVLVYFRNMHLSWNPSLFSYSVVTHGFWPSTQGPQDDTFNVGENPQYIMTLSDKAIKKRATIWILLSRHVTKQEQEGSEVTDYLTLHIHQNQSKNERIWYPSGKTTVLTGAYTNNPHVLARYEVTSETKDKHLSLVLSQYKKSHDLGYTLSCFCTEPFDLNRPVKDLPCRRTLRSEWTPSTAGGPPGEKSFETNPMWIVRIPRTEDDSGGTHVQFRCSASQKAAVNVLLVPVAPNQPHRLKTVKANTPVIDSGSYRHGYVASGIKRIPEGNYTLVVSTYDPGVCSAFTVDVLSSSKVVLEKVR